MIISLVSSIVSLILTIVYSKVCHNSDIILGLTSVVNSLPDKNNKANFLNQLCQPFATAILEVALKLKEDPDPRPLDAKRYIHTVVDNLERLTLIVKNLDPASPDLTDHVMVSIFNEVWVSILHDFLLKYYVSLHLQ